MTDTPYITFGAPQIGRDEIEEMRQCLESGWLGTGPRVKRFEAEFSQMKGLTPDLATAVNSCTAALHVSMIAAEIEPGSEVITTPLTFCATVNAIIHAGLKPVLADVNPETQCIDADAIQSVITDRTRAIIPVHMAGHPCDMNRIMKIADDHNLTVIEDCAHAVEAEFEGIPAGTFGHFGCFSFYVTKNLVTGEGGMILGKDGDRVSRARVLALHGMSKDAWHRFSDSGYKHYQVVECGFKYNMTDMQASLGIHQLRKLDSNWQRRREIWDHYHSEFSNTQAKVPHRPDKSVKHSYHLFTLQIRDDDGRGFARDDFLLRMHQSGIGTGVHYLSVAEHPFYQHQYGWRPDHWPHAMKVGRQTVSLPLSPALTDAEVERIVETTRRHL